jgi:hypothetical protein
MELTIMGTDESKKIIAKLLADGISLSDIQGILAKDHDIRMTFLELRLIASELENVDWGKFNKEEPVDDDKAKTKDSTPSQEISGRTVVEISKLVRPGAVASGTVSFGSGAKAEWILDQMGRLGLDKAEGKPTEQDLKEFQEELQKALT